MSTLSAVSERLVRERHRIPPTIGKRLEFVGDLIPQRRARIADDFEIGAIVKAQDRQEDEGRRVPSEIGGNIAQNDAPFRIELSGQQLASWNPRTDRSPPVSSRRLNRRKVRVRKEIQGED